MAAPNEGSFRQLYKPVQADPKFPDYFHTQFGGLGYYGEGSSYGIVQGSWCKVIDAKILLQTPRALLGGTYKGETGGWKPS